MHMVAVEPESGSTTLPVSATRDTSNQPELVENPWRIVQLGSQAELAELLRSSDGNVLLDFHADWCSACKLQNGMLDQLKSTPQKNQALIVKVDFDQHPELARQYQVSSLPTLLLLRDQKVLYRHSGVIQPNQLVALFAQ